MSDAAILPAFWAKARREFVPLMANEIAVRSGVSEADLDLQLKRMVKRALMDREILSDKGEKYRVYELTKRGQRFADALIQEGRS